MLFLDIDVKAPPKGYTDTSEALLALGAIAHDAALKALGEKRSAFKFGHGARHRLKDGRALIDSYHCSRYNTSTGVLTPKMFRDVFAAARAFLDD